MPRFADCVVCSFSLLFDDSFTTDDFSELLREVREGLILGETFDIDTEDEIEQDDEMLAISVIDDVDEDEENV